jgi:hypothetical protein
MRIDDLAQEMAASLLQHPDDEMIEVWKVGEEWGWARLGEGEPPPQADLLVQERVQNGDADPTEDSDAIDRYALDLLDWLHSLVDPEGQD